MNLISSRFARNLSLAGVLVFGVACNDTTGTTYRLGTNKGFRIVGQINQDLDLFRMPLEIRVDTDGKSEMKRIDVVGTQSTYSVETFGKPRRIVLDPNNWVLKNSPELRVRVAILRGQQLVAQGDLAEALKEYQKALDAVTPNHKDKLRKPEIEKKLKELSK